MLSVLRTPGVLRVFGASCVARLTMGALGLLLVLHVQAVSGSYARGGLAAGAYTLALGISNPVLARLVDRRGQTLVLRTGAVAASAGIVTLAPLAAPGVRVLVVVFALAGLAVGAVEVAVPAILTPLGQRDLTGLMLALWGVGSMAGGGIASRAGAAARPARRLALLMAGWGVIHGAVGLRNSAVGVGLLLLAAGVTIAPPFVCADGLVGTPGPPRTPSEGFSWLS